MTIPNTDRRPVIYQMIPRLFTNYSTANIPNGTYAQNGSGKLNDINAAILRQLKRAGYTHVWYTGVIEHAHKTDWSSFGIERDNPNIVKGEAGSPYAISDYYDIDPDLAEDVPARMAEFEALVERTHAGGLKVIIDFVPNHLARIYHSDAAPEGTEDFGVNDRRDWFFHPDNNFYYIPRQQFSPSFPIGDYVEFPAKATGNDCFTAYPSQNDWYETVKLNYGVDPGHGFVCHDHVPDTWHKMLRILRFWAAKGIDGFRCDMVHMVPVEFWQWAIPQVKQLNPSLIFIAEIYDVGLYRPYIYQGHFDYLYDKVTLYDTLRGIMCHNLSAAQLTSCWQTVDGISGHMLNFLENHDEQRLASQQFAGTPLTFVPAMVACATMNTGALMVYMGQELGEPGADAEGYSGQDGRTTIFDYWGIASIQKWLRKGKPSTAGLNAQEKWLHGTYSRITNMVNSIDAFRDGKFFDVMYVNYDNPAINPHSQYVYLRSNGRQTALVVLNFADSAARVEVRIPEHAFNTLGIKPIDQPIEVNDPLNLTTIKATLTAGTPTKVAVDAHGAAVLVFENV